MKECSFGKVRNYYDDNRVPILGVAIISIISVIWLSNSTANVPIMDYWRDINELTEKVFRGEFSFNDMWTSLAGHRGGFAYLFIALNIRYLGMNTLIGIYLGLFVNIITSILLYIYYKKKVLCLEKNEKLKKILFLLVPIALFSFNQWEIYTLAFSFSFALRRLLYFITFLIIEKIILKYDSIKKYMFEILIYLLVIMLFMSGGYLPAFIGSILFCFIINTVLNFKQSKKISKQYLIITCVMILGLIIYMKDLAGISENGQSIMNLVKGIFNGSLFKGIFIMLGSSVIDSLSGDKFGTIRVFVSSGFIVFLIYLLSLWIYFSKKMWERTYIPLFLMAYTGINIIVIYYARSGIHGIEYLSSSRYSCETILGVIGVMHILIEHVLTTDFKFIKEKRKAFILCIASIMSLLILITTLLSSYAEEFLFASYRKNYQNTLVDMMLNIDDYTDAELSVFQANKPEQVRNGIYLMKKYKLGVFRNFDNEKYSQIIGSTLEKSKKISGIWNDGWLAKESKIKIATRQDGKIFIKGYYPFEITDSLTVTIYVNDIAHKFKIDQQNFNLEVSAPKNDIVTLKFYCDFEQQASKLDSRMVTFILNRLEAK